MVKWYYHKGFNIFGDFVGFIYFKFEEIQKPLCQRVSVCGIEPNRYSWFVSTSFTLRLLSVEIVKCKVIGVE